jgi:uncharacterized protein YdhG (YjbR/CyaY superfamily)
MKKMKDPATIPSGKAGPTARDVDDYLAGVPEPARTTLSKIRAAIVSALPPRAVETISFRIPAYKYKGLLVGFAAFTTHCTLATMSRPLIEAFREELARYETADTIIRFPHDKPLPAALVRKIVKARVVENECEGKW